MRHRKFPEIDYSPLIISRFSDIKNPDQGGNDQGGLTPDATTWNPRKRLLPSAIQFYLEHCAMENIYLSDGESILLTSQNVVIEGIRHEAVLTSRRLIVVRLDDPKASHQEIPLVAIRSAIAGENALHEPTITLSLISPDGTPSPVPVQLVFIRLASEHRNNQYDEWVARLKEHVSLSVTTPAGADSVSGLTDQKGVPQIPSYVFRLPKPVSPPPEAGITKIAVSVIVIAALLIVVFAGFHFLSAKPAPVTQTPVSQGQGAPAVTTVATPAPEPSPALTVQPTIPQVVIPASGVWVRIQYPGIYTGSVGTSGNMRQLNSTGDRFYQIPITSGVIEGDVHKSENTGDELAVTVYKDGSMIQRVNTRTPGGTLILSIPV
jgi:hypothetical protein